MPFDFFTPTMLKARARELNARVDMLASDMVDASYDASTDIGNAYGQWALGWREFYSGIQDSSTSLALNATRDELETYKNQFEAFALAYKKESGNKISVPTIAAPWKESSFPWGWVVIGGLGVAGWYIFKHVAGATPVGKAVSFVAKR